MITPTPHTTVASLLRGAKARIADPEHWIQGAFARHADGSKTSTRNPEACRFCSLGALTAENYRTNTPFKIHDDAHCLFFELYPEGVAEMNDTHTHAEVMAAWDRVIAEAEKRENAS